MTSRTTRTTSRTIRTIQMRSPPKGGLLMGRVLMVLEVVLVVLGGRVYVPQHPQYIYILVPLWGVFGMV